MNDAPTRALGQQAFCALDVGLVGATKIGRTTDEVGHRGCDLLDHVTGVTPRGVGLVAAGQRTQTGVPTAREAPGHDAPVLGRKLGMGRLVGGEAGVPLCFEGRPPVPGSRPLGCCLGVDVERLGGGVSEVDLRGGNLVSAEGGAVRRGHTGHVWAAPGDRGAEDDKRGS